MKFRLIRDAVQPSKGRTYGVLFAEDEKLGQTLEDEDRQLETGGIKVYGKTCIPRGTYELLLSLSSRFGRIMPEIRDVADFSGVRIHGGNTTADTLGCPLLGRLRTETGLQDCAGPNARLKTLLEAAESVNRKCTIEIS